MSDPVLVIEQKADSKSTERVAELEFEEQRQATLAYFEEVIRSRLSKSAGSAVNLYRTGALHLDNVTPLQTGK